MQSEKEREESMKIARYLTSVTNKMDFPSTWMGRIKRRFEEDEQLNLDRLSFRLPIRDQGGDNK